MVLLACGLMGCRAAGPAEAVSGQWPQQLAGRALRAVTDDYVLYASDARESTKLREWLDAELASFRSRHGETIEGQGLALAIEPGDEPVPAVEQWRRKNVDRTRRVTDGDRERFRRFLAEYGRPYCLSDCSDPGPYFTESFSMPREQAVRLGMVGGDLEPAWICFLTTDRHTAHRFDELRRQQLREGRRQFWKDMEEQPGLWVSVVLSSPGLALMALAYPQMEARWRSIDIELMHLQRREVLWEQLLDCSAMDAATRQRKLELLRIETHGAWGSLWLRRPTD